MGQQEIELILSRHWASYLNTPVFLVDPQGNPFGLERVQDILSAHHHQGAQDICETLWQAVQNHSGETLHQDDFTTVVIKRE